MAYEELIKLLETHKLEITRQVAAIPAGDNPMLLEAIATDLQANVDALNDYLRTGDFEQFKQFTLNFLLTRQNENVPIADLEAGIGVFFNVIVNLINQFWTTPEQANLKNAAIRRIDSVCKTIKVAALTLDIKRPSKQINQSS